MKNPKRLKPLSMHGHNPDDVLAAFLQVKPGEEYPKGIAGPRGLPHSPRGRVKEDFREPMPNDRKKRFQWEEGDLEVEVDSEEEAKELRGSGFTVKVSRPRKKAKT